MKPAELHAIAGGGIRAAFTELAAEFERASGHKVIVSYGTAPELIRMAIAGDPFDIAVVPRDVFKDAAARARFAKEPARHIARVGLGIAVRRGAPKPDIRTPAALKQTLLDADSIASIPASATGTQLADIYHRLGITEEMKAKTKPQPSPPHLVEAVANGEAKLGVFGLNILMDSRLDVAGPMPGELQREVVYAAAIAANSTNPEAAQAFMRYLLSPPAAAVIKAKGMNPA
jgi:molybdate transport system substrate-binding protein